ncbi:hypothetical protein [Yersinia ruckeri]|uniref:hypothetical protein n=1 Tax=Yersinia ruckeri TaxID=29486 RepID=UPI0022386D24|nr:hypothetical protein [Yersinia ruckeri]MCW6598625.1 hypothetical protein [Yersinia ruckeri]
MKTNTDFACMVEHLEAIKTLFKHLSNAAVLDSLIRLKPMLEIAKLEEHEALQVAINIDNIITDCSKRSDRDHSAESACHEYVIKTLRNEQYRYYVMGGHANGAFEPDPFNIKHEDILELKTEQQWTEYCEKVNYNVALAASMNELYFLRSQVQHFILSNPVQANRMLKGALSNFDSVIREREKAGDC